MRFPVRVAATLIVAELIVATATAKAVDHDARIRATAAYGEIIVSALRAFEQDSARLPTSLDDLRPRYLQSTEHPAYGIGDWEYHAAPSSDFSRDEEIRLELLLLDPRVRKADAQSSAFSLSVRLSDHPGDRFVRDAAGCWRVPYTPRCW